MADLSLNQIKEKLNKEFLGDTRKLIFWYDGKKEFISYIEDLKLDNAKVLRLKEDNQFYTKYFLEREDKTTNYLIYAPFEKPPLRENHLADTIRYSKEFFADRVSLLIADLGIDERYKDLLDKYRRFFSSNERCKKFYNLKIKEYTKEIIELSLMSIICKTKTLSFEEILREILSDKELENGELFKKIEKYNLLEAFWEMSEKVFGYKEKEPKLINLVYTLFTTYTLKILNKEAPKSLKEYYSYRSGSVIAFLDNFMNNLNYDEAFERLSSIVYTHLGIDNLLMKISMDDLFKLELFKEVDEIIIKWMIERLQDEDILATLNGHIIEEICIKRRKMHYGKKYASHYYILENAYYIIKEKHFEPKKSLEKLYKNYINKDYIIDQKYRYFYYHYDKVSDNTLYERLSSLVGNIYINRFLNPLCVSWSSALKENDLETNIHKQTDFYNRYVKGKKGRVIVIISDALRFEVGKTLAKKLTKDERCKVNIEGIQGVIPSYTRLGMAALLPHKEFLVNENGDGVIDNIICNDLKSREKVLRSFDENSKAVQFDEIGNVKQAKEITKGQEVVYIYHNQIDAIGDKPNTENEVFKACEEAINEIYKMIKRLTTANNTNFIITADHGFIYKRSRLSESEKISNFNKGDSIVGKRYIISDKIMNESGVYNIEFSKVLKNSDKRFIVTPIGSDIFKASGGGQNFVHGGISLQETIIPLIEVKTKKSHIETSFVKINLISSLNRITNLNLNLEFIQNEAVTNINKEATYKLCFVSENDEIISNESIYTADSKEIDSSRRIFKLGFMLKNMKYSSDKKYYFVICNCSDKEKTEVFRKEVQIDLAFFDDFDFFE